MYVYIQYVYIQWPAVLPFTEPIGIFWSADHTTEQ
jgi:hypothetical protein